MCSIYGAFKAIGEFTPEEDAAVQLLREAAGDRGRDGGRAEIMPIGRGTAILGNWRATPTPELEEAPLQPYDGIVHNGTIANDRELGAQPGEVDSMVLPRILNREKLSLFAYSLQQIEGSYAIAAAAPEAEDVFLACNYKPIHIYRAGPGLVYFSSMARHFSRLLDWGRAPQRMEPYTVMSLRTGLRIQLRLPPPKRALVIASAGLDSTVVASHLRAQGYEVGLLHFGYGCRAEQREAERVGQIAEAIGATPYVLALDHLYDGSASPLLQDAGSFAQGIAGAEWAHEWVPGRNLAFVGMAAAFAEQHGYHFLALGNNLEEAGAYPDNEEQFTELLDQALAFATQNGYELRMLSPVGHLMKHEIVALGLQLGAPLGLTWSCYRGGRRHCGECGPCFMRREAFLRNRVTDPVFAEPPTGGG